MATNEITGTQVKDGTIRRADLNTATAGSAVITKAIAGTGISLGSTGADAGTGDVTINTTASVGAQGWFENLSIIRATTTNAGDSIKLTSADGTALSGSNTGKARLLSHSTPGQFVEFSITADVTILLTGAHWDHGGRGDLSNAILRFLLINDNNSLRCGVAKQGGRTNLVTTDTSATQTSVTSPEGVLCNTAVGSSSNTCRELGYFKASFDDIGGAAEDLWAVNTTVDHVVTGQTADGLWQPWNITSFTGFSSNPSINLARWMQHGKAVHIQTDISANGTSNASTFTINLPIKASGVMGGVALQPVDLGVNGAIAGWRTVDDSVTLNIYRTTNDDAWSSSGTKNAEPIGIYEAHD